MMMMKTAAIYNENRIDCCYRLAAGRVTRKRKRPQSWSLFVWFFLIQGFCHLPSVEATKPIKPAAATTTIRITSGWRLVVLRGGAKGDDDNTEEATTPSGETADWFDTVTAANNNAPKAKPWDPWALFRLNDQIKFDLSIRDNHNEPLEDAYDDEQLSQPNRQPHSNTADRSGHQRGGALVKTAVKPAAARRFNWLAPLDTKRVAPSSSRLLIEEDDEGELPVNTVETSATKGNNSRNNQTDNNSLLIEKNDEDDDEWSSWSKQQNQDRDGNRKRQKRDIDDELSPRLPDGTDMDDTLPTNVATTKAESFTVDQPTAAETLLPSASQTAEISDSTFPATAAVGEPSTASAFASSGYWSYIDRALTLGYAGSHPAWRVSHRLRRARKLAAKYTGLHGVLSGKKIEAAESVPVESQQQGMIRRRLAAIDRARKNIPTNEPQDRRGLFGRRLSSSSTLGEEESQYSFFFKTSSKDKMEEARRKERVKEIDKAFIEGQKRLMELACEKDMLQRRPNPLWNYTIAPITQQQEAGANTTNDETTSKTSSGSLIEASRRFAFPPQDLVDEYLDMLFLTSRLVKLNHTDLWKNQEDDDEEDELVDDYRDASRLRNDNGKSNGNWLLRHGLGEKIGEATERAAYKAVCKAVMSVLARSISSIHGANVMKFSDIRLSVEQAPNLPPLSAGSNYAKEAIADAMHRGARKQKKRRNRRRRASYSDQDFIQRDAVVETLLSHCQISAPLLTLFPLAWQRALLGNIIMLVTAVIADFCEGVEFQILGHRLSFAFTPLTEEDVLQGMTMQSLNRKRAKPKEFEAAVEATAAELSQELNFLDRWHERALGSGMLRSQIANLIARLVLVLIDDVLGGARMDLWSTHAGGPRLVAGLEYRTTPNYMGESNSS